MTADRLAALAAQQHGTCSLEQAREYGLTRSDAAHRVATGRWLAVHRGVYRFAGAPDTWHSRIMAAALAGGRRALASHRAAARLWGLLDDGEGCELVVPYEHARRIRGVRIHRSNMLVPVDRRVVDSVPVTSPELTLLHLGSLLPPWRIDGLVDSAIRRRLTSLPKLRWRRKVLGRQGRNGCGVLREVLDARDPEAAAAESRLERAFFAIVKGSALAQPRLQHVVTDPDGRFIARVDAAWIDQRVVAELDGAEWHAPLARWAGDLERRNALEALGWRVVNFTYWQVMRRPRQVLATLDSMFSAR